VSALSAALAALVVTACASSGSWAWRRADGSVDSGQLRDDIAQCEEYRQVAEQKGPDAQFAPRAYGEWGNSSFEYCMGQKHWRLQYVTPGSHPAGGARP
jgi:hypothetical protein